MHGTMHARAADLAGEHHIVTGGNRGIGFGVYIFEFGQLWNVLARGVFFVRFINRVLQYSKWWLMRCRS